MRRLLIISWIALIGATRIDLTGGAGDFLLTPFLLLSPLLLAGEAGTIAWRGGSFRLPTNTSWYFLVVSSLVGVVLLSTFLSADPHTAARRSALLAVQVYMVLLVVIALANRPDRRDLLVRGATAGLILCLLLNAVQLGLWFSGNLTTNLGFLNLEVRNYAGLIPRLSGTAHDPSIGGLLILFYLFVLVRFGAPSRMQSLLVTLGVLSLLLTLSRSVVLAGFAMAGTEVLLRSRLRLTRGMVAAGAGGVAAFAALLLVSPTALSGVTATAELLSHRLAFTEGSSSEHAVVMARAWEVATANTKQLLVGIGYGNAYLVLQDLYPGDRYGNFHSLYMTLLAESGIFALVLALVLFGVALLRDNPWRPAVAAMVVYNIFQQNQTDPTLWLVLSFAWLASGSARLSINGDPDPPPTARVSDRRETHEAVLATG
jgi:hypothetical protein